MWRRRSSTLLTLSLSVQIDYKELNSHKSLFILAVNLSSSIALRIFTYLQLACLFSLIFLYKFNE